MTARRLAAPILLGVFTVLAIVLLTGGSEDRDILRQTFELSATYYEQGHVEISFYDRTERTESAVMEILGMRESYQKSFPGYEFVETVDFSGPPKYGWAVNPVVLKVEHPELGHVQLKTEIRPDGQPPAPVIYSVP